MIGLDTNVILRYLLQDDPRQSRLANRLIDGLTEDRRGFINLVTILEIVWVLRSFFARSPVEIAEHVERLLVIDAFEVQNEQQVFEAVYAMTHGAEFEDALIGALNGWAGCSHTFTFDRKAAKLAGFRSLG